MHRSRTNNPGSTAFNGDDPARFAPETEEEEEVRIPEEWSLGEKFEELLERGYGWRRNKAGYSQEIVCVELGRAEIDPEDAKTFRIDLLFGIDVSCDPLLETLKAMQRIVNAAERAGLLR